MHVKDMVRPTDTGLAGRERESPQKKPTEVGDRKPSGPINPMATAGFMAGASKPKRQDALEKRITRKRTFWASVRSKEKGRREGLME